VIPSGCIMAEIDRDNLLLVGVLGPAHGVRGEMKVIPETDDPARLLDLERVWIGPSPDEARQVAVESARMQASKRGPVVLLKVATIKDRDHADALRRQRVYAHEDDLPDDDDDGLFLHDLIGLRVIVETDGRAAEIGTVSDVVEGVAQNLLVISRPGAADALVPDVPEIVTDVDLEAGTITLSPPDGLFE
jgi:16S rRNA processing protein RimM